jgi:hypothetical protein
VSCNCNYNYVQLQLHTLNTFAIAIIDIKYCNCDVGQNMMLSTFMFMCNTMEIHTQGCDAM